MSAGEIRSAVDAVAVEAGADVLAAVSNPPTHAGCGVTRELFAGVHDVLAADDTACLVANSVMECDRVLAGRFSFTTTVLRSVGGFDATCAVPA